MRLSEYASTRKTRGSYKLPRSVQQSIPIDRIYADGVWQSENVFSLMWQMSDRGLNRILLNGKYV